MWLAYYNFAVSEKELYQIMFGVGMPCCEYTQAIKEDPKALEMFLSVISEVISDHKDGSSDQEVRLFYTFWAFIHGAVSSTIMHRRNPDETTLNLVTQTINAIIESMCSMAIDTDQFEVSHANNPYVVIVKKPTGVSE
jgi:hypothetical protein